MYWRLDKPGSKSSLSIADSAPSIHFHLIVWRTQTDLQGARVAYDTTQQIRQSMGVSLLTTLQRQQHAAVAPIVGKCDIIHISHNRVYVTCRPYGIGGMNRDFLSSDMWFGFQRYDRECRGQTNIPRHLPSNTPRFLAGYTDLRSDEIRTRYIVAIDLAVWVLRVRVDIVFTAADWTKERCTWHCFRCHSCCSWFVSWRRRKIHSRWYRSESHGRSRTVRWSVRWTRQTRRSCSLHYRTVHLPVHAMATVIASTSERRKLASCTTTEWKSSHRSRHATTIRLHMTRFFRFSCYY